MELIFLSGLGTTALLLAQLFDLVRTGGALMSNHRCAVVSIDSRRSVRVAVRAGARFINDHTATGTDHR